MVVLLVYIVMFKNINILNVEMWNIIIYSRMLGKPLASLSWWHPGLKKIIESWAVN